MLVLEHVNKYFGGKKVLDDISLYVERGELVVILGPNGAGKTTLLNTIAGIIAPDSGRIVIGDKVVFLKQHGLSASINVPPEHRNVGYVPQDYALFPHLNVFENIALGLRRKKLGETEVKRRVRELMEVMEINGIEEKYPHQLSDGEKQRVAIARALAPDPEILLLDEPFSSIDPLFRERARVKLKSVLQRIKVTTLMVTHDLNDAWALSDKIVILMSGRIVGEIARNNIFLRIKSGEVARFFGFNVLEGIVCNVGRDYVDVLLAGNSKTIIRVLSTSDKPSKGSRVYLFFRPDDVVILHDMYSRMKTNVFEAIVSSIQITRSSVKLELRLEDTGVTVKAEVGRGYLLGMLGDGVKPGSRVYVHIPPRVLMLSSIK